MADTNSWSDVWNMPMTPRNRGNPNWERGEIWEEALLDYNILKFSMLAMNGPTTGLIQLGI